MSLPPVSHIVGAAPKTREARRLVAPAQEHYERELILARHRLAASYVDDELRAKIDRARSPEDMQAVARSHGLTVDDDDQSDTVRGKLIHFVMDPRRISGASLASMVSIDKATLFWRRKDAAQEALDASIAQARHEAGDRLY